MKLKDVTDTHQNVVSAVRMASPQKDSNIKIYENGTCRFIHEVYENEQVMSISRPNRETVPESDWILAINHLMKLSLVDIQLNFLPSGVLFISKKDESLPKVANCQF
ncbi:hypothetical protein [Virgibacillus phage Mimir87]|nr:hypothetical protein [Virgibacillus phage Mimir87]